jgi:hypothetical protein
MSFRCTGVFMSLTELREIPDHPGFFVSSVGQVLSTWALPRRWGRRLDVPRSVKQLANESGHMRVRIGGTLEYVHRLVLRAFVGPCPDGQEVRHLDGNPANNNLANLAYGTRSENIADALRHGTTVLGEAHHMARLTAENVRAMRKAHEQGVSVADLGRQYGITHATAGDAVTRRTWKHVP